MLEEIFEAFKDWMNCIEIHKEDIIKFESAYKKAVDCRDFEEATRIRHSNQWLFRIGEAKREIYWQKQREFKEKFGYGVIFSSVEAHNEIERFRE